MTSSQLFVFSKIILLVLFIHSPLAQAKYNNKLPNNKISKIAFGCCAQFKNRQDVWWSVNRFAPDLFIFMGDNVLADTDDMEDLEFAYSKLQQHRGFRILKLNSIIMNIWDDLDYGEKDSNKHYKNKLGSRQAYLNFWREPMISPRYTQQSGINYSLHFGKEENRVQVIMLDTRWQRDSVKKVSLLDQAKRATKKQGPYISQEIAEIMNESQWQWLAEELDEFARLRIIVSSNQMLGNYSGHDNWALYPKEQARLFNLLKTKNATNTILLGGGTHWAELTSRQDIVDYPLYEITPGSLTEDQSRIPTNRFRRGKAYRGPSYGTIEIQWLEEDPQVTIELREVGGKKVTQRKFALSHLN